MVHASQPVPNSAVPQVFIHREFIQLQLALLDQSAPRTYLCVHPTLKHFYAVAIGDGEAEIMDNQAGVVVACPLEDFLHECANEKVLVFAPASARDNPLDADENIYKLESGGLASDATMCVKRERCCLVTYKGILRSKPDHARSDTKCQIITFDRVIEKAMPYKVCRKCGAYYRANYVRSPTNIYENQHVAYMRNPGVGRLLRDCQLGFRRYIPSAIQVTALTCTPCAWAGGQRGVIFLERRAATGLRVD